MLRVRQAAVLIRRFARMQAEQALDTILPGQFDNYFVELAGLFARGEPSQEQNDALSSKRRLQFPKPGP